MTGGGASLPCPRGFRLHSIARAPSGATKQSAERRARDTRDRDFRCPDFAAGAAGGLRRQAAAAGGLVPLPGGVGPRRRPRRRRGRLPRDELRQGRGREPQRGVARRLGRQAGRAADARRERGGAALQPRRALPQLPVGTPRRHPDAAVGARPARRRAAAAEPRDGRGRGLRLVAGRGARGTRGARGRGSEDAPAARHRRLPLQGGRRGLPDRRHAHAPVPAGRRQRRLRGARGRPGAPRLAPGVLARRSPARLSRQPGDARARRARGPVRHGRRRRRAAAPRADHLGAERALARVARGR